MEQNGPQPGPAQGNTRRRQYPTAQLAAQGYDTPPPGPGQGGYPGPGGQQGYPDAGGMNGVAPVAGYPGPGAMAQQQQFGHPHPQQNQQQLHQQQPQQSAQLFSPGMAALAGGASPMPAVGAVGGVAGGPGYFGPGSQQGGQQAGYPNEKMGGYGGQPQAAQGGPGVAGMTGQFSQMGMGGDSKVAVTIAEGVRAELAKRFEPLA